MTVTQSSISSLESQTLAPQKPVELGRKASSVDQSVATIYNRIGGLLHKTCKEHGVKLSCAIAVWVAEGGWRSHKPGASQMRFHVHQFFDSWGRRNRQDFDLYFRYGGHNLQPGQPWENQEFRTVKQDRFSSVHHNENSEYCALTVARTLAGDEIALACATIGGCHLAMKDSRLAGFSSELQMFEAFQESEAVHVTSFFSLCRQKPAPKSGDLLLALQQGDWVTFTRYYQVLSPADIQPEDLKATEKVAQSLLAPITK